MLRMTLILIVVLLGLISAAPATFAGGDHDGNAEAWAKAMTPGKPHADLAAQAGEWTYVVSIWEDPARKPMRLSGVATKTMIMGGRFIKEELLGEFMGRPFQGLGIAGYDNVTGELVSIWLDNMGTAIHHYTGTEDASGVQTYTSEIRDPATGRATPTRSTLTVIDADRHTFESSMILPDGSEVLHMRVEYTRAGA